MKKLFIILFFFNIVSVYSQMELVPPSHPVYDFLKRMQLSDFIPDYNSSDIPISRAAVASYLISIEQKRSLLNSIDKGLLDDYLVEFEYDVRGKLNKSHTLFKDFKVKEIFSDRQKYLYSYVDSNATIFFDVQGYISQRNSVGDSLKTNNITLGELGVRVRGTLIKNVGYYLRMSNGQKLIGDTNGINMSIMTYPKLKANTKYKYEQNNFDTYEGYLRYATQNEWVSIMVGKEALLTGFGYIDKLFFSDNTVPFSYLKIGLKYKALSYYFLYGSLKGDSMGIDLSSKNIASHRLNINFSDYFKMGFFESIIIPEQPFNFTFLNPLSFLRSADYNSGENMPKNKNNALMGIDFEIVPTNKLSFQGSLLIDDLNFSTLFNNKKGNRPANDNRFGVQLGLLWVDAFTIPATSLAIEYTRLDPFVYSHRTNKSQYTNWSLPLGHNLSPNSDEIAVKINSYIYKRLNFSLLYQYQRSGTGIIYHGDTLIANYGNDINRGDGDLLNENIFLNGNRINRHIVTFNLTFQPIRQYFIELKYQYRITDFSYLNKKYKDSFVFFTVRVDY